MPKLLTDTREFTLNGVIFESIVSPSRGSRENSVWIVTIPGGSPGHLHSVSREEIFVAMQGEAIVTCPEGDDIALKAGSALIVPPGTQFALGNPGAAEFRAMVVLPVGARACVGDGPSFIPPWAQ